MCLEAGFPALEGVLVNLRSPTGSSAERRYGSARGAPRAAMTARPTAETIPNRTEESAGGGTTRSRLFRTTMFVAQKRAMASSAASTAQPS